MSAPALRLAVLDRDSGFLRVLAARLRAHGYVHQAFAGPVVPERLDALRLHAVVIDVEVLGERRWELLERLCAHLPALGVVVVTAPSTAAQRARGLRLGADDWMTKPCHPEEVLARVEAVVRRRRRAAALPGGPLGVGDLELRPAEQAALVAGRRLDLTAREAGVLRVLAEHEGEAVGREALYEDVWGHAMARGERSVDVHVRRLRRKLEQVSSRCTIHTHVGVGYRLDAARERELRAS